MKIKEITKGKTVKTFLILFTITLLYMTYTYQGDPEFFLLYLNRSPSFIKAQANAQYYQWVSAFFLLGLIPALIVKIVFRERFTRYGLFGGRPLPVVLITLFGIVIITPITYFGSKRSDMSSFYPLVLNAGDSPILFVKSSLFYVLYYIGYEFCFRGYLFLGIKEDVGEWQALAISLIATVLLHVNRSQGEMIMTIIIGVAFPLVVDRFKSLWPAVFMHAYAGVSLDYWIILRRGGF
jgi:membrane protease YdiL (CAAX protease family)